MGCGFNNATTGDGTLSVVTDRYDVTPASFPALPTSGNFGSSMVINPAGTRIIGDTFPNLVDQTVTVNTEVFVIELSTVTLGSFTHDDVSTVPSSMGHTLAASDTHFGVGGTVPVPIVNTTDVDNVNTVALFVKTLAPPWSSLFEITNPVNNTDYGYALAIEEDEELFAVGAPGFSNSTGRVYVYDSLFGLLETIVDPEPPGVNITVTDDLRFGHSLLIYGDLLFIGAPGEDDVSNTTNLGAVYLYERNSTSGDYTFLLKILPPNVTADRGFGWSLDHCDGFIVIGSEDSELVEVYKEGAGGNITASVHHQSLTTDDLPAPSTFGQSVAIQCNLTTGEGRIVVGDTMFPTSASARGKVFTYEYSNSTDTWVQCQPLADAPTSFTTRFGQRVALTPVGGEAGTLLVVAAPDTDSVDNDNGHVWIFDLDREAQCTGCDNVTNSCILDDQCGICGGNDTVCAGCDGVPNSGLVFDFCGVCGGDGTTCINITNIIDIAPSVGVTGNFSINATCNVGTNFQLIPEPQANAPFTWLITSMPSFGTVTIDPDDDDDSIPEFFDDDDEEIEYFSSDLMPPASDSFDVQVTDSFGNTDTVTVNVTLQGCVGCDNVTNSGMVFDVCGMCGGNGTSCLDCNGDPFGTKIIDFCGVCVEPDDANTTCFFVYDRPNSTVPCLGIIEIANATWDPGFPDDRLHWDIIPPLPTHGVAAIGDLTGLITYAHTGVVNATDVVHFQAENPEDLIANATAIIEIVGCGPLGCDGVPGSGAMFDMCGVCNGINACVDCAGVPFGNSTTDLCGVCNGNNTCLDCAGTPFGSLVNDSCGVCGGDNSSCADCAGVPNGNSTLDLCGVCNGNDTCLDCNGVPFGSDVIDLCGVCGGNNSCVDCAGTPFGNATLDMCNVCNGNNSCVDCNGVPFGGDVIDLCGVCGGNNSCVDCNGVPFGPGMPDMCGVCDGNNTCVDCNGVPFGGAEVDQCGVCGGSDACLDCAGTPFGNATTDVCGTCAGTVTDPEECPGGLGLVLGIVGGTLLGLLGCCVVIVLLFLFTRRRDGDRQRQQPVQGYANPLIGQDMEGAYYAVDPRYQPPHQPTHGVVTHRRVVGESMLTTKKKSGEDDAPYLQLAMGDNSHYE